MVVDRFKAGTVIRVTNQIKDKDGALIDPTTIKISISDPAGTAKVTSQDMTRDTLGNYSYLWQSSASDALGMYTVKVTSVYGSYTAIEEDIDLFELC